MVGNVALRGVSTYAAGELSEPAAVVIAYTGDPSFSSAFPPTFVTGSADDRIANPATVERRVRNLKEAGVEVEGTDAEGWIDHVLRFWEDHR